MLIRDGTPPGLDAGCILMVGLSEEETAAFHLAAAGAGQPTVAARTPLDAIVVLETTPVAVIVAASRLSSCDGQSFLDFVRETVPTVMGFVLRTEPRRRAMPAWHAVAP